jgi:predicted enzyme related to lactoylglutathione lyase
MGDRTSHAPGTISWADLATTDQAAAKEFYGGLFGWEYDDQPIDDDTTYSMAKLGGRSAAAISPQQQDEATQGVPPHWNVYVTVDDVDATTGSVSEYGGNVLAGPFDVFDAGRMSVIADPAGAVLCLWQAGTSIGAEVVNEPGALTWADTATTDAEASQAFYVSLLGWSFEQVSEEPPYWVISNDGRTNGGMTVPPPGVPPSWFPYFAVEDVDAAIAAAREAGGQPFLGPVDVPNGGRFALIQDPQGAAFAVVTGELDD